MRRGRRLAGERCSARALQLDIAPLAVAVHDLAKEDCAAVTKLRNEIAKLMPGIGHSDRLAAEMTLPANNAANSVRFEILVYRRPVLPASDLSNLIRRGFATGVGESRAKKCSGRRA